MSLGGFIIGFAFLGVILGSAGIIGSELRRRLMAGTAGSLTFVAEAVLAMGALLIIAQLLGALGWLRTVPLATVLATAALCLRRTRVPHAEASAHGSLRPQFLALGVAGVAAVIAGAIW